MGNIGQHVCRALLGAGHSVTAFDLQNRHNFKASESFSNLKCVWGDLRSLVNCREAVIGVDAIVHLAAVLPPASDYNPELAQAVNVDGTANLIAAAEAISSGALFLCASSVSLFGRCEERPPRIKTMDDPAAPSDVYTETKSACETLVKESSLRWSILRLVAVPPLVDLRSGGQMDSSYFSARADSPVEFCDVRDVATAFCRAVTTPEVLGKTLLIGGGKDCQLTYGNFVNGIFGALGIGALPERAFGKDFYYTHYVDSAQSQAMLKYQNHSFPEYLEDQKALVGCWRVVLRIISPFVRFYLCRVSKNCTLKLCKMCWLTAAALVLLCAGLLAWLLHWVAV